MANDRPVSMKTKEYRKVVKPLLERRRRARINGCLNELRNFILDATKQDSVQASKLEKADILEMTVHYLRLLLRQQCSTTTINGSGSRLEVGVSDVGRFRAGFTECANEVSMFVAANMSNAVNPQVRSRLLGHLSKCLNHLDRISTSTDAVVPPQRAQPIHQHPMQPPPVPAPRTIAPDQAQAQRIQVHVGLPQGPLAPPPPPPPPYTIHDGAAALSNSRPPPLYSSMALVNNGRLKTWTSEEDDEDDQEELEIDNDNDDSTMSTQRGLPTSWPSTPAIASSHQIQVTTSSQGHCAMKAAASHVLKCADTTLFQQRQLVAATSSHGHHQGYHSLSPSNSTILVTVMQPEVGAGGGDGNAPRSPVWRPW